MPHEILLKFTEYRDINLFIRWHVIVPNVLCNTVRGFILLIGIYIVVYDRSMKPLYHRFFCHSKSVFSYTSIRQKTDVCVGILCTVTWTVDLERGRHTPEYRTCCSNRCRGLTRATCTRDLRPRNRCNIYMYILFTRAPGLYNDRRFAVDRKKYILRLSGFCHHALPGAWWRRRRRRIGDV